MMCHMICTIFLAEPDYPVRLVSPTGSLNESNGCVQIYHQRTWGSLCNYTSFSQSDAHAICRTLGFVGANSFSSCSGLSSIEPVWLSDISCNQSATSIEDCSHSQYGLHMCTEHSMDIAVTCNGNMKECVFNIVLNDLLSLLKLLQILLQYV